MSTGNRKLIRGRYVIADPTALPAGGIVDDGAVVVENDKIVAVGTNDEMVRQFPDADRLGSERHVVMPGLVNSHAHGYGGISPFHRGVLDDYVDPWLFDLPFQKPIDAYLDTLYENICMLRSGVTTALYSGLIRDPMRVAEEMRAAIRAYDDVGMRLAFTVPAQDREYLVYGDEERFIASLPGILPARAASIVSSRRHFSSDEFLNLLEELIAEYADHPRVNILAGPQGPIWCSDGLLARLRELVEKYDLGVQVHLAESTVQRDISYQASSGSGVEHLRELGLLGPKTSLAHGIWLTDTDIDICAESGTTVCHNASCNLRLHMGVAPVVRMLERGVNVAIGSDSTTFDNDDDFLKELRVVSIIHRLPHGYEHFPTPSASDVLRMATVNGARATTLESEIGVLEPGRQGDIVLLNFDRMTTPYISPDVHIADAIIALGVGDDVDTVLVAGEVVVEDGKVTTVDEEAVVREIAADAAKPLDPEFKSDVEFAREIRPHVEKYYAEWQHRRAIEPYCSPNPRR